MKKRILFGSVLFVVAVSGLFLGAWAAPAEATMSNGCEAEATADCGGPPAFLETDGCTCLWRCAGGGGGSSICA